MLLLFLFVSKKQNNCYYCCSNAFWIYVTVQKEIRNGSEYKKSRILNSDEKWPLYGRRGITINRPRQRSSKIFTPFMEQLTCRHYTAALVLHISRCSMICVIGKLLLGVTSPNAKNKSVPHNTEIIKTNLFSIEQYSFFA